MTKVGMISFIFCFLSISAGVGASTFRICEGTPFPDFCNSLQNLLTPTSTEESKTMFRNLAIKSTMERAQRVLQQLSSEESGLFNPTTEMARKDCVLLLKDTIFQLNRSIEPINEFKSFYDSQTWLSASISNLETCKSGFAELDSSFPLSSLSLVYNNVTEFLRNALAINKIVTSPLISNPTKSNQSREFPTWLSHSDRKLLIKSSIQANLVVAKDGSGNYKTISDAVVASLKLRSGTKRFVIHVKSGVYEENILITERMINLMLIGDGVGSTIVTGSRSVVDGFTTFNSATVGIDGEGFIAKGITFRNTAGPSKYQAVALRSSSDHSIFYSCTFKGHQDTLYIQGKRQFYRNCNIYGTIDFIFGDAAAVFQNCNIYVRKPNPGQINIVTAQGRMDPNENTGISIHNSRIMPAPELVPVQDSFKTYLGRPWKKYSRTVIMKSELGRLIHPSGWLAWNGNFALDTLYYGEYKNIGSGAGTSGRVKWRGFRVITSEAEAAKFTVNSLISGNSWIPASGVPFTSGL